MTREERLVDIDNLTLGVAALSGDIYLTILESDYEMGDVRVTFTEKVQKALHEWHVSQQRSGNPSKGTAVKTLDGETSYLYHTTDDDKAKRIKAILEED